MGTIYNATNETQRVKVFGNYFEFKPGQMKSLDDKFSQWLTMERGYLGLVPMPEEFTDPEYAKSEEGAQILAERKAAGVRAYTQWLRERIRNVEVSLRQDLEKANIKSDPRTWASDGEVEAYELLAKYQKQDQDATDAKAKKLAALEAKIKGV
jgi:hypothetical protein